MGYFAFGWPKVYVTDTLDEVCEDDVNEEVLAMLVDPGFRYLATVAIGKVTIWSARIHRVVQGSVSVGDDAGLFGGCWSPNGDRLACAGRKDGKVRFWRVLEGGMGSSGISGTPRLTTGDSSSSLRGSSMLEYDVVQKGKLEGTGAAIIRPEPIGNVSLDLVCEVRIGRGADDQLSCICCCGETILLGTSGGHLVRISWDGEIIWRTHVPELLRADDALRKLGLTEETWDTNLDQIVNASDSDTGGGLRSICFSEGLELCGVVLGCGASFLLELKVAGTLHPSAVNGRWLRSRGSVCIAIESDRMLATVGLKDGEVEHFYVAVPAGDRCPVMRRLSLSSWYFDPEDVGAATVLSWTPDGSALVVGWEKRGLAVWSVSGCRLMWTLPQIGGALPTTPSRRFVTGAGFVHPMENGVRAAAWGPEGYFLWASPRRVPNPAQSPYHFMEFDFCKSGVVGGSAQSEATRLSMIGSDRVLLLGGNDKTSAPESVEWRQIQIPYDYLWRNWPPAHIAVNDDFTYLAVAGATGVASCNVRNQRWHIFGDIGSQEQPIRCCALGWYQKWMIVGNENRSEGGDGTSYEILFYPRDPLDSTVLQAQKKLNSKPLLIDIRADGYLMILGEDSIIIMLRLVVREHFVVKTIAVEDVYKIFLPTRERKEPPSSAKNALVLTSPGGGIASLRIFPPLDHALQNERERVRESGEAVDEAGLKAAMPTQMLLLRTTGSVILLDARRMLSMPLLRYVEHFWYTQTESPPFEHVEHRPIWWAYGDDGLHVCFRSGMRAFLSGEGIFVSEENAPIVGVEQWFELDPEVYPLGLMSRYGMVLGASQGLTSQIAISNGRESPCHVIKVKRQPVLHTILRHLLLQPNIEDKFALAVAIRCSQYPQFIDSLEWLLYEAVLEHDHEFGSNRGLSGVGRDTSLFPKVVRFLRYFGEYEDVVVRCARKMDSKRWPLLFSLAGEPAALLEQCYNSGRLTTAACLLVILQEMWGFMSSTPHSLRLLEAALSRGEISLAADLSGFLAKADQAGMLNASQMRVQADVSWMKKFDSRKRRLPAVDVLVCRRAEELLDKQEFRELVAVAVRMNFPLSEWLRRQKAQRPVTEEISSLLLKLHRQFQWPEPKRQEIARAIAKFEESASHELFGTPRTPTVSAQFEENFGRQLPPPPSASEPDRMSKLRAHARKLCREELTYLRKVSQLAGTLELTLCVATLLLDVPVIINILFQRDVSLWKSYIDALSSFHVPGYGSLVESLEILKKSQSGESSI